MSERSLKSSTSSRVKGDNAAASGPKQPAPKPAPDMPPPRKPRDPFIGQKGFAALSPSSMDPVEIAHFAMENLGSSFPSNEHLRTSGGHELKSVEGIKQRIAAVKKQQAEELQRVYMLRNAETQDLLEQQWLGQELDSVPTSTMVVHKLKRTADQPHDETFLSLLANQRRMHEHATDDLVDRVRFSHLQTLTALRQKQAITEKLQQTQTANAFPRTIEEFHAIADRPSKIRIARFLVNPNSNFAVLMKWTDTEHLVNLMKTDHNFRASVTKIIDDSTGRDPRLRA